MELLFEINQNQHMECWTGKLLDGIAKVQDSHLRGIRAPTPGRLTTKLMDDIRSGCRPLLEQEAPAVFGDDWKQQLDDKMRVWKEKFPMALIWTRSIGEFYHECLSLMDDALNLVSCANSF